MGPARDRLLAWLRLLVDAEAVTGSEEALCDELERRLAREHVVQRVGDSLVVGRPSGGRRVVALVGHLDVVPPTDTDRRLRVEERDGRTLAVGRGTSDMHAGNAVALDLLTAADDHVDDLVVVLYAREEGPADDNELADVLAAAPWLAQVDLAVVLEPTDGVVQLGCLGGVHATVTFTGRQAHSARPWDGRNAVTAAGAFLTALDHLDPVPVSVEGIEYRDVWTVTQASTNNARNIVPGTFSLNLNFRFSPTRTTETASRELRDLVHELANDLVHDCEVEVEVVDQAPPAPPHADDDLVRSLLRAVGRPAEGKQAWTDVARLAALGVPAVNFGPGLTAQAHQRGEYVPVDAMLDVRDRLGSFLARDDARH